MTLVHTHAGFGKYFVSSGVKCDGLPSLALCIGPSPVSGATGVDVKSNQYNPTVSSKQVSRYLLIPFYKFHVFNSSSYCMANRLFLGTASSHKTVMQTNTKNTNGIRSKTATAGLSRNASRKISIGLPYAEIFCRLLI